MPVIATLGAGNGFAACCTKVDVSSYDMWTTLSGHNKDSVIVPSPAQIHASYELAVSLFWNLRSLNFTAHSIGTDYDYLSDQVSFPQLPQERVCLSGNNNFQSYYYPSSSESYNQVRLRILIMKLYNGSTEVEDNFIGYGATPGGPSAVSGIYVGSNQNTLASTHVRLGSYMSTFDNTASSLFDFAYVQVSGCHFVGKAYAQTGHPSNWSAEVNAVEMTAQSDYHDDTRTHSSLTSISSFDFY